MRSEIKMEQAKTEDEKWVCCMRCCLPTMGRTAVQIQTGSRTWEPCHKICFDVWKSSRWLFGDIKFLSFIVTKYENYLFLSLEGKTVFWKISFFLRVRKRLTCGSSSFVSIAVIEYPNRSNFVDQRVYLGLHFHIPASYWREVKVVWAWSS